MYQVLNPLFWYLIILPVFRCRRWIETRNCSVGTVETCIFVKTQIDTAKVVKQGLILVLIVSISLKINKKWTITWPRTPLHHLTSNQRFAHFARRSFRVTIRSNNIGEKSMERNNGKQVIRWQTWTRLLRRKGKKLKEELSACQHFLVDTEMKNGRHKVFNFQM